MGASNFARLDASRIFAVELEDEWSYGDLKENVTAALEELPYSFHKLNRSYDVYRSYPGTVLCQIWHTVRTGGVDVEFCINCIVLSGYHEGCNLDWEMHDICVDGNTPCDLEQGIHDAISADNPGLAEMISTKCYNKAMREFDAMTAAVEKVYEEHSTPLKVVAQFSNGETMYEKA